MGVTKWVVRAEVLLGDQDADEVGREIAAAVAPAEITATQVMPMEGGGRIWGGTWEAPAPGLQLHVWASLQALLTDRGWAGSLALHECRPGESCRNETYREWRRTSG